MHATGSRVRTLLIVLLGFGCGGDGGSDPPPPSPLAIAKASSNNGDQQLGPPGTDLPNPLRVVVTRDAEPAAAATVTWATGNVGAVVVPQSATTDANGIATATFRLGSAEGAQTASASVSGGASVTFDALALPNPPATVAVWVGNLFFESARNLSRNSAVDTVAVGGTVTWTWIEVEPIGHDVQSDGSPSFVNSPISSVNGFTYSVTFDTPGTYRYYCLPHALVMTGRVVVR